MITQVKKSQLFEAIKTLRDMGLTTTHRGMLFVAVSDNEGAQAKPLAEIFYGNTTPQTIAKLAHELEDTGLIECRKGEFKEGSRSYHLTKKGKAMKKAVNLLLKR